MPTYGGAAAQGAYGYTIPTLRMTVSGHLRDDSDAFNIPGVPGVVRGDDSDRDPDRLAHEMTHLTGRYANSFSEEEAK